ncbi:MAG: glycosyltransferase family 39 protein [Verrucomicrobia bacterium]|nr:glycosyltransferase family 39 protein [Verrucomicrobiota bacterium]
MREAKPSRLSKFIGPIDPVLLAALVLALLFSLYGIRWGRVECWNRDDMAMRGLSGLRPGTYEKPPFHTYLNHALVIWPIDAVEAVGAWLSRHKVKLNEAKLLESRLLITGMFLATVALAYWISLQCFGKSTARIVALVLATSAGFIEYEHFLTCDSPLLLWMLVAFFFARRVALYGDAVSYALGGFATGIATATKYNGLAVGITIPIAHLFGAGFRSRWRRFFIAMIMVPAGFIAGAPAAPFQWRKLVSDFTYNAEVTPHYGGQTGGRGYWKFLKQLPEILGWPGALLVCTAAIVSVFLVVQRRTFRDSATLCFALAASVFLLYFAQIGAFARMETRFVLPAVPFLILMCGPAFQMLSRVRIAAFLILVPLIVYNTICSLSIGYRLNRDPRIGAQNWIARRASEGDKLVIESSGTSPRWIKLPEVQGTEIDLAHPERHRPIIGNVRDLRMPEVNGRVELFGKLFGQNSWVQQYARGTEGDPNENLFTLAALRIRNPDVITVHSTDYNVPSATVRKYYADLFHHKTEYALVYSGATIEAPPWIYPRKIDFLDGRMTILTRPRL